MPDDYPGYEDFNGIAMLGVVMVAVYGFVLGLLVMGLIWWLV